MNIVIDLLRCLTRRNVYSVVHHYRVFSERVFVSNMVGTVDRRSQSLKATRKWRDDWMAEVDKQGDRVGDWAQQVDIKTFRCRWCNTVRLDTSLHKYNSPANTLCFFVATKTSATGGQEYKKQESKLPTDATYNISSLLKYITCTLCNIHNGEN